MALQQAIEKAVYGLVMEGAELKLWSFADPKAGYPLVYRYDQERDGVYSAAQVRNAMERSGELPPDRRPNPTHYSTTSSTNNSPAMTKEASAKRPGER